jgi:rhodanese-related sulfurtransferase
VSFADVPTVPVEEVPASPYTDAVLLDVRESDEWANGHAPDAVHIPMSDVPARIDEIDIDAVVYVVCRSGGRSMNVVPYLNQNGFEAFNVAGGMVAWQKSGRPLVADDGRAAKIF